MTQEIIEKTGKISTHNSVATKLDYGNWVPKKFIYIPVCLGFLCWGLPLRVQS